MKGFIMFGFIKTAVLGGLLFLFPIVFVVAIIGKSLEITIKVSVALAGLLPCAPPSLPLGGGRGGWG
jgi:uncharacterized SAM-binding protein YcdF (DUF218 family)